MRKQKNKIDFSKWPIYSIVVISIFIFMQTCGTKSHVTKSRKKIQEQVDSLSTEKAELKKELAEIKDLILTKEEMTELIKDVPAWNTLRIEEISDKERISINALKAKEEIK